MFRFGGGIRPGEGGGLWCNQKTDEKHQGFSYTTLRLEKGAVKPHAGRRAGFPHPAAPLSKIRTTSLKERTPHGTLEIGGYTSVLALTGRRKRIRRIVAPIRAALEIPYALYVMAPVSESSGSPETH